MNTIQILDTHIEIYHSKYRKPALISLEDLDLTEYTWKAFNSQGYIYRSLKLESGKYTIRKLHHDVACKLWQGPFTVKHPVEHLNHDKYDARRTNLFWSTALVNSHRSSNGSYHFDKNKQKYKVCIGFRRSNITVGYVSDKNNAAIIAKYAHDYLMELLDRNHDLTIDEVKREFFESQQCIPILVEKIKQAKSKG